MPWEDNGHANNTKKVNLVNCRLVKENGITSDPQTQLPTGTRESNKLNRVVWNAVGTGGARGPLHRAGPSDGSSYPRTSSQMALKAPVKSELPVTPENLEILIFIRFSQVVNLGNKLNIF